MNNWVLGITSLLGVSMAENLAEIDSWDLDKVRVIADSLQSLEQNSDDNARIIKNKLDLGQWSGEAARASHDAVNRSCTF